jgi:hypothetical protein|tara:strand:- start:29 stop:988 length:960 start_codon:yes stop_codon:yes gene_type:complete
MAEKKIDIFDLLQEQDWSEWLGPADPSDKPFKPEVMRDIDQMEDIGTYFDMYKGFQKFKDPDDYFNKIKGFQARKTRDKLEDLVYKKAEEKGYIGSDYDRYDRPKEDIKKDIDITNKIIAIEALKKKPKKKEDLSMWQKIGKHFSENAAARDKLFTTLGSMGKEFVKPIEPGKEAAGALLPTLSRGVTKGEEEYASKQAAATKRMLDMAEAQQKVNPLQYYSTKMKEAKTMVPEGIEPGSLAETTWIGNYLRSQGIPGQVLDLQTALTEAQILLSTVPKDRQKEIQANIDGMIAQINALLTQSMGGGGTTGINIPYLGG